MIDSATAHRLTAEYPLGPLVAEGKTKKIFGVKGRPDLAIIVSKDDITAGDGKKHDIIPDKGKLSTETTCNVFRLIQSYGCLPIAYVRQDSVNSFISLKCKMLPYEVVVRRQAHGSYLKRHPHLQKGHVFNELIVEFFLKTSGKRWKGKWLICDDPLLEWVDYSNLGMPPKFMLFNPAEPIRNQEPFLVLAPEDIFGYDGELELFPGMQDIAKQVFSVLEKAWEDQGGTLVDFKVEFGLDSEGGLLLADVIDNDSWRVVENGSYIDKQVYRDGGDIRDVAAKYKRVADITGRFLQGVPA